MTDSLNRKSLYDLVWQKPMVEVAKEYGLSDRGMAKLCERHSIPVPPRGYWAQKQADKKTKKPPLIMLESEKQENIILSKRVQPETQTLDNSQGQIEKYAEEIQEAIDNEGEPENTIKLPKTLSNPHRIIHQWLQEEQRRSENYSKYGIGWRPDKVTSLENRRRRIFSVLLKALEHRSFKVEASRHYSQSIQVSNDGDGIYIQIEERIRQYRRELTAEEKKNRWNQDQRWTQEREPTGKLRLRLTYDEKNHVLQDFNEDKKPLEDQLNSVVAAIIKEIEHRRNSRLAHQEAEHRWYLKQEERRKIEELEKKEREKRQKLEDKASQWKKAALIREYVAAIEGAIGSGVLAIEQDSLIKWKTWALSHANEIDPIIKGEI